jgi:hypothetical protein
MHSNTSVSLIDPINWRAGCVNSACPVRREGELTLSLPLSVTKSPRLGRSLALPRLALPRLVLPRFEFIRLRVRHINSLR